MKYSLRSLMITVLVLPPLLAFGWWGITRFTVGKPSPAIPNHGWPK